MQWQGKFTAILQSLWKIKRGFGYFFAIELKISIEIDLSILKIIQKQGKNFKLYNYLNMCIQILQQQQAMGLQQHVQKQLGIPLSHIISSYSSPQQHEQHMSLLHIFDAELFSKLVLRFLPDIVSISQVIKNEENGKYHKVWNILKETANQLGINLDNYEQPQESFLRKTKIAYQQQIIDNVTWDTLRTLSDLLLQIMVRNENVLFSITKMDEKYQVQIKEYLESHAAFNNIKTQLDSSDKKSSSKTSLSQAHIENHLDNHLLEKVDELQHCISAKDLQITTTKSKLVELKQQLNLARSIIQQKQTQIRILKGRISAYSEIDLLFEQKDEEIAKLMAEIADLKLKTHTKHDDLMIQVNKLKQINKQLEGEKSQLLLSNQHLISQNQLLRLNGEQRESADKKVISNLKEKIKVLNERLAQQQKHMMDVLIEKDQKDKELFQLEKKTSNLQIGKNPNHEDFRTSARKSYKLVNQLGDLSCLLANSQNELKQYYEALFGEVQQKCTKQLCIALRSQYIRVVQQILEITNDTEFLTYITPTNRLQCILNQLQKIHEISQQNLKLKQKIVLLQSDSGKGNMTKQSLQQINKLKKQLLVMKRKLQDMELKRKQQLQILVSVIGQNYTFDIKS